MPQRSERSSIHETPPRSLHRRLLLRSVVRLAVLALAALSSASAHTLQSPITELEADHTVRRELAGGERHSFQITLAAGEYLHVIADQQGIDLVLRLSAPDGRQLVEMDSPNSTQGPEVAALIAEQPGVYRVEVRALNRGAATGRYELRATVTGVAGEHERRWVAAQAAFIEGERLRALVTADARRQAIAKYESAIENWRAAGDKLMQGHALCGLGVVWLRLNEPQKALECYRQALKIQQAAPQWREEAYTLFGLGVIHSDLGEPRTALEFYSAALARQRTLRDAYAETQTLGNMGLAHLLLGEVRRALEYFGPALKVWERTNQRAQQAATLHNTGRAYEALGEFQPALEVYLRALALRRLLNDREGVASELNSIGFVNGALGEWPKALEYYGQALALWRTAGNRRGEAVALGNIGRSQAALERTAMALDYYEQALKLHHELGNRQSAAVTLEDIGSLHAATGSSHRALEFYEQSLSLRRATGDRWGEASTLASIGLVHVSLGEVVRALEYLNESLVLHREVGDQRGEARVLYGIARAERRQGKLDEARRRIEDALALVESVRAGVGSRQLRASFFASVRKYYEFDIDLLMQLHRARPADGYDALAVQAGERARARGLLELLTEAHADIRQGADTALIAREHALAELLSAKSARRMQLAAARAAAAQLDALDREISAFEDEHQQVQAQIRRSNPRYAALTQPQPAGLAEIRQLLDDDSLLLEYALGEERSFLWAVTKDTLSSYELPTQAEIARAATAVYELLTARSRGERGETPEQRRLRVARAEAQLPDAAARLSRLILGPVADRLKGRKLVVVADGALQYIPFAMLPLPSDEAGARPLVAEHEIVSLPSASVLSLIRKDVAGRHAAQKMIAVFADPVFSRDDERVKVNPGKQASPTVRPEAAADVRRIEHDNDQSVTLGRLVISRLPFTRQEAERILAVVPGTAAPGASVLKALDFNASRDAATSAELADYRYLHFATHGYLDSERPGLSALVLSLVDEQGAPRDGFLRANEIYNLRLLAELVVLSACQTGLGKEVKGEGLIGLTRGFMYAGAPRVVVSLWNVNDKATAELMAKFYERMLKDGQRPAAALRSAQVEMWRQKQWQAPYYWAAFVLQGEWK